MDGKTKRQMAKPEEPVIPTLNMDFIKIIKQIEKIWLESPTASPLFFLSELNLLYLFVQKNNMY